MRMALLEDHFWPQMFPGDSLFQRALAAYLQLRKLMPSIQRLFQGASPWILTRSLWSNFTFELEPKLSGWPDQGSGCYRASGYQRRRLRFP